MKVKTKVFQLAEELGACFTINSTDRLDVEVEAPRHKTWSCDPGVHCLVGSQWDGQSQAEVWADLLDRMQDGVEDCEGCVANVCDYWTF
jgi:hypothetical protein